MSSSKFDDVTCMRANLSFVSERPTSSDVHKAHILYSLVNKYEACFIDKCIKLSLNYKNFDLTSPR